MSEYYEKHFTALSKRVYLHHYAIILPLHHWRSQDDNNIIHHNYFGTIISSDKSSHCHRPPLKTTIKSLAWIIVIHDGLITDTATVARASISCSFMAAWQRKPLSKKKKKKCLVTHQRVLAKRHVGDSETKRKTFVRSDQNITELLGRSYHAKDYVYVSWSL